MLHAQGVVHRDIKPPNLLLRSHGDDDNRLLVADLGVAKAMLHASGLTQVVGTPAYMAPEQANGLGVDSRADIHALAAVAYQLLTGAPVRDGRLRRVRRRRACRRRRRRAPTCPPRSTTVILRALEPDPDDRYPEVAEFASALRHALPVDAAGPGAFPADGRRPGRRRAAAAAAVRLGSTRAGLAAAVPAGAGGVASRRRTPSCAGCCDRGRRARYRGRDGRPTLGGRHDPRHPPA